MFHDPDPLAGRFFNSRLFWVVIVIVVGLIGVAMYQMQQRRAVAKVQPKVETKALVTELPRELQGDDTHLKLAQRVKATTLPPDLSGEVERLRQELAALRAERNHTESLPVSTVAPAPAPQPSPVVQKKAMSAAVDPEAARRKQEALEAKRQQVQEEKEARQSGFAPIRHDKADEQKPASGLTPLRSRHTVFAGSIIPLVMENALNSESPDTCVAHVAHDVFDGLTGETVLIPYGSTVTCTYQSAVFGQERLLPKAQLLTLPNGETLKLDGFAIATASGQAGLDGDVDHHWGRIWASIPLSVLRAGALATSALGNDPASRAAGVVVQDTTQRTTQAAQQSLLTNPTIRIERAKIGLIILPKALELRPYR